MKLLRIWWHRDSIVFMCAFLLLCHSSVAQQARQSWTDPRQDFRVQQALKFFRAGNYKQATVDMQKIVAHPNSTNSEYLAGVNYLLGLAYQKNGNLTEAHRRYYMVTSLYPNSQSAKDITDNNAFSSNSSISVSNVDSKINSANSSAQASLLANDLIIKNQSSNRIRVAKAAVDAYIRQYGYNKASEDLMWNLGNAYENANQSQLSYNVFQRMQRLYPDGGKNAKYIIQQGFEANMMHHPDDARRLFDKALTMNPDLKQKGIIMLGIGICFRDKGDYKNAKYYLNEAKTSASTTHDNQLASAIAPVQQTLQFTTKMNAGGSAEVTYQPSVGVSPYTVAGLSLIFIVITLLGYRHLARR